MKEVKAAKPPVYIVANFSGNVGKTALTKNLLAPRLPGVEIFPIETVNSGYENEASNSGVDTRAVLVKVLTAMQTRPCLIDVGASNAEVFFQELVKLKPLLGVVTGFIIPTMPEPKAIIDTLSTVDEIIDTLGFDPAKVFIVFNKIPGKLNVEEAFKSILIKARMLKFKCIANGIDLDETFLTVAEMNTTVDAVANDKDYLSALATVTQEDLRHCAEMAVLQITARGLQNRMNSIFAEILKA